MRNPDRDTDPAIGTATQGRVGWFRLYLPEDRWEWSEAVARMHEYQPGTVTPTTELVLSHKHPGDGAAASALLDRARHAREPCCSRYRIITTERRHAGRHAVQFGAVLAAALELFA